MQPAAPAGKSREIGRNCRYNDFTGRGREEKVTEAVEGRRQADGRRETGALAIALWSAGALLIAACGLLWARFGPDVFLDAALSAWRSCF